MMSCRKHLFLLLALWSVVGAVKADSQYVDITDRFSYCWGGEESMTRNADGSITFYAKTWGGLAGWFGDEDWSEYSQLVFELREPSPCVVQPLVLYQSGTPSDGHYMEAGTKTAYIDLDEVKSQHVSQVALQTNAEATIVVERIYLVKKALVDNGEQPKQLRINELMQSNIDCIMDDLNEFPDSWVELYNSGTTPVNLARYKLGLTSNAASAWQLPVKILEAGQFVVVYCDKVGDKLHTDFRLDSGKGGAVYLFFDGEMDDQRTEIEKQPAPNISLGYKNETGDEWGYQYEPTPGAANCGKLCKKKNLLGEPIFSEKGRVFTTGTTLQLVLSPLTGSPDGTVVRYTLDGSEPTSDSPEYTSPLTISQTTTVRAKAFYDGYLSSRSATQSYIFLGRDMTLPVVSLVTDDSYWYDEQIGIIVNNGDNKKVDWRRPVNIEFFDAPDTESKINQLCETRVQGGATRSNSLKSLAIYANKRFGTKRFTYEFFPDQRPGVKEFKSLLLRNAGNDFYDLYMRDAIIQRTMGQHVDLDWQAWRPAIVFKNGVYKGMLNIRERSNEDNVYSHYQDAEGDGLEDIDMFENWWDLKEGDWENYNAFQEFYAEHNHTLAEYAQWMDWEEFFNLMIMGLYFDNKDFPGNNIVMWRPRAADGKWRWIAKDTDFGLGLYGVQPDYNTIAWLNEPGYDNGNCNWANGSDHTRLFRRMMEDADLKREFLDRAAIYMGDFLNERGIRAVWDPMVEMIKDEYPYHKNAGNGWRNWNDYQSELTTARQWAAERTTHFYQQLADYYEWGTPTPLTVNKELETGQLTGVTVSMNGIRLSQSLFDGKFYAGKQVTLKAEGGQQPVAGWSFVRVNNDDTTEEYTVPSAEYTFEMPTCKSLAVNALFGATGAEEAYYYVGWLNSWSTTDKSYPLKLQADGVTWEITLPAAGDSGWFKIAPASAYGQDNFWNLLLCAPWDGCRELSGNMSFDSKGAWLLPNMQGIGSYTVRIKPAAMTFEIVPNVETPYSGTLPVLYIDTESDITSTEEYVAGTYYIDALGLEGYSSLGSKESPLDLQIKGRGNWTWSSFDKKPYRLKLDKKASPLGMKQNKHFNLIANADDSFGFLRNTVGFELSRMLGLAYTPEQRPVEVVLNGNYIGLYMLTDKIRVDKTRVNIVEQADNETNPDNITGGWLLEIDNYEETNQVKIRQQNGSMLWVTYHTPEVLSDVQHDYLTNYLQATDAAIFNTDKSSTDWENYIDMDALARFYIVQEVMDDGESFHGSCYMHKERGADTKLVFGPVWDFGNAFSSSYDKFIYENPSFEQYWIGEIARYPRFQQTVKTIWQTFITEEYPKLNDFIDSFATQVAAAAVTDGARWPEYSQNPINDRRDSFKYRLVKKVNFLCQQWGSGGTDIQDISAPELDDDVWYTLDGRRLNGAPSHHGLYVHQGRKVVIKQ